MVRAKWSVWLGVTVLLMALSGCERNAGNASAGSENDRPIKLTFAFQPQENPEGLQLDTRRLGDFISERTGYTVEIFLPTNYAAVVEALRGGHADVAYFSGWPYLIAHDLAGAELLVAEERQGKPFYESRWYVRKDSSYESLTDLKGKTIAFTSPTSTSGFLFPMSKVVEEGHLKTGQDAKEFFGDVVFAGGYQQALLALANGTVEAAAASDYALGMYLSEAQQAEVRVLVSQGPVPTHGIAVRGSLPDEVKAKVREALLALNEEENKALLKSVYGAEKLVPRTHEEHVQALDRARKLVGIEAPR
jgi:phosphonate transport system substrate-binding protein